MSTYDLFISYASEDKDDIAEPLANGLMQAGLRVWFDDTCISIGDSIFSAINEGLKRSRFALVILSPAYLQKQWTVAELQALFDIEMAKKSKHILPVWHKINQAYLREHCPSLKY